MRALRTLLPESETDPAEVIRLLSELGGPATMAISGGRFFGFVIGGCLPAAMAASWLVEPGIRMPGSGLRRRWRPNWKRRPSNGRASCLDCLKGPQEAL